MLTGLFALGTIGFGILLAVATIVLIVCVEYERPTFATLTVVAAFLLLGWLGDFNLIAAVRANPLAAVAAVAAYFALGAVWAMVKWWFFLKNARDAYDEAKRQFLRNNGVASGTTRIPDHLLEKWRQEMWSGHRSAADLSDEDGGKVGAPKVSRHKGRIMIWMAYWPWSFVWTMVNDPVKRAFKAIYRALKSAFQKISDGVFNQVDDDFRPRPDSLEARQGVDGVIGDGAPKDRSSRGLEGRTY